MKFKMFEWFTDLFPKSEDTVDSILDAFDGASDEVADFIKDIRSAINEEDKQFLIEVNISADTKIRPLKAAMEAALTDMLSKQYPECSAPKVKSYYYRNA